MSQDNVYQQQQQQQQQGRNSPTAGEEVLRALYTKACEDRDALAATNAMYSKMLEACAEQNGVAERLASAAKEEVEEMKRVTQDACLSRDEAVIKMQAAAAAAEQEIARVKAAEQTRAQELTAQLLDSRGDRAENETKLADRTNELYEQNKKLRALNATATSQCAFLPRIVSDRQNAVRKELAAELSSQAEMLKRSQQALVDAQNGHAAIVKGLLAKETELNRELDAVKLRLVAMDEARMQRDAERQNTIDELTQANARTVADANQAKTAADEAKNRHDRLQHQANSMLEEATATFTARLQDAKQHFADHTAALLQKLETLSQEYAKETQSNAAEQESLRSRAAAVQQQLLKSESDGIRARQELALATQRRNAALAELRRETASANADIAQQLAKRTSDLLATQKLLKETIERHNLPPQLPPCDESRFVVAPAAEENAQQRSLVAALTVRVSELEAAKLEKELQQSVETEQLRGTVHTLQEQIGAIDSAHQAALSACKSQCAAQLDSMAKHEGTEKDKFAESVRRLDELVSFNAQQVRGAAEQKAKLDEANRTIQELRRSGGGGGTATAMTGHNSAGGEDDDGSSPVGTQKRRRK